MDKELLALFSERLREAMGDRMNQNQLAAALGMTRAGVGNLFHGVSGPSVEVLAQICRELGVSADWLIGLVDEPKRRRSGR